MKLLGPNDPALNVLDAALRAHPEWDTALEIVAWPDYRNRLMQTLTAAQGEYEAVCVPGHIWLPELAHAGYLAELDWDAVSPEIVEAYDARDVLGPVAAECRYAGCYYLLPLFTDGHILFYRADLVSVPQSEGVPVVSTRQVEELAARASSILDNPPDTYGLALKAHPSEILLDWLPYLYGEEGGEVLDDKGKAGFAGEAGVRALERYCALRQYCPPDTHTFGNSEIAQVLREGRVALAASWGGQAASILLDLESKAGALYRCAVFPHPWSVTWGVALAANQAATSQHAVLEVLLQASGPAQDREVTRLAGSPVRARSYAASERARYPWLDAQFAMLERARQLPVDPRVGPLLGVLYNAVYTAFTAQAAPDKALREAEDAVNQALG